MIDFTASIRLGSDAADAIDPNRVHLAHHLAGSTYLEISRPTGGHFLHLAVGMCIFNGLVEMAAARSIALDDLRVDVSGDFAGEGELRSSGITVDLTIDSPASDDEIRQLVADTTDDSPITRSVERGTPVRIGSVTID